MKKYIDLLKECVKKLNDDDLKYIGTRLTQRLGGDVGEAIEFLQKYQEIDCWLSSAATSKDIFDMIDLIEICIQQEIKKRFGCEQKEKSKPEFKNRPYRERY